MRAGNFFPGHNVDVGFQNCFLINIQLYVRMSFEVGQNTIGNNIPGVKVLKISTKLDKRTIQA